MNTDQYTGPYREIDMSDLPGISNSHYIKNFYLLYRNGINKMLGNGESFVFNGFSITLCTSGEWRLRISGRNYCINAGTLLILAPNQLTETISVSEDLATKAIIVSLDVILEHPSPVDINILNIAFRNPAILLTGNQRASLSEYFDFIEQKYSETDNAYREEISKTLLYALMLEICNAYRCMSGEHGEITKPRQEQLTDDFFKLLTTYYKTEHNVGFYADRLNRTPKYLSEAIRRISGKSVPEWISTMLVNEIKLILKTTDKTVLEISEELNFSSPSVFVQFFRHNTGTTPMQYRKQL